MNNRCEPPYIAEEFSGGIIRVHINANVVTEKWNSSDWYDSVRVGHMMECIYRSHSHCVPSSLQ